MGKILCAAMVAFTVCASQIVLAETWYVDSSVSASGDGGSPETAFKTIQEGIDAASDGDTVTVAEGTYGENIHFKGKNIVLRSSDPTNPGVVEATVIDGGKRTSVATFAGTEDETCVLSGFTIRSGKATLGGGICGGTATDHTHATIRKNTITANSAWAGGGVATCDGLIEENTVSGNSAETLGGGLYDCHGTIQNNLISANTILQPGEGGGLAYCHGAIRNNRICRNTGYWPGGGLFECNGDIANNVIVDNLAGWAGGGLSYCNGAIRNCIVWGNSATEGPQIYNSREPTHSCIQNWTGGGAGNTADDPLFVDPDGPDNNPKTCDDNDYRLTAASPCIDGGKNDAWMWQAVDPDGAPRILWGRSSITSDMGAYEYLPAPGPAGRTWYVDGSVSASGDGTTWETAKKTIQEGIDVAVNGDSVLVSEGIYLENIRFNGKNIVLRSSDALGNMAVSGTVIDGSGAGPVVTFSGAESATCVLSGFTLRNGGASAGGGILGGTSKNRTGARIENNLIVSNSADNGGGIAYCDGPILNNTICGNSANAQGGGLYSCPGTIRNCIIWGNSGANQIDDSSSTPTYSCLEHWTPATNASISYYPYFVDSAAGDYHLEGWSPCIDRGDPISPFSQEPEPSGGRVNMGAFGNTGEAAPKSPDADRDGLPDDWETKFLGSLGQGKDHDPDRDFVSNLREYRQGTDPAAQQEPMPPVTWYVDGSLSDSGDGLSWETAFMTIQEGINAAIDGDAVIVAEAIHVENVFLRGKNIVLRSADPLDGDVVANTIIDGGQSGPVVTFDGTEDERCLLSGFTIQNGSADAGAGICGGTALNHTHASIQSNIITGNSAWSGGGLALCDGVIGHNTVRDNSASSSGGGGYLCHGAIQCNTISDNFADFGGGLESCNGTIRNNLVTRNSAGLPGGGLYGCHGNVENNTISVNLRSHGAGGVSGCAGTVRNCIIWGNASDSGSQIETSRIFTYCCIQGGSSGEGNVSEDPQFVDYSGGDYRLSVSSPCIDKGLNQDWMSEAVDLDGNPRIWAGTVDMGAYEYDSFPFRIREIGKGTSGDAELTWNSRPGDTYTVWSSPDPSNKKSWVQEESIPSGGDMTTWTDSDSAPVQKFYRISVR